MGCLAIAQSGENYMLGSVVVLAIERFSCCLLSSTGYVTTRFYSLMAELSAVCT